MAKRRTAMVCGKLCTAPEGDYYVTCSFDPNHVILRSRMPYHIIKCVRQHTGHNKVQCPYDATEYLDSIDFYPHILTCESRRSITSEKYETAELKANGNICNIKQTPFFHSSIPVSDEDWGGTSVEEDEKQQHPSDAPDHTIRDEFTSHISTCKSIQCTYPYELQTSTPAESKVCDRSSDEDDKEFVGVGRGMSIKKPIQKRGMGRAALLKLVLSHYQTQQTSDSADSLSSRVKEISLSSNVANGQFEDI